MEIPLFVRCEHVAIDWNGILDSRLDLWRDLVAVAMKDSAFAQVLANIGIRADELVYDPSGEWLLGKASAYSGMYTSKHGNAVAVRRKKYCHGGRSPDSRLQVQNH